MNTPIRPSELRPVPAVVNGLPRLKETIREGGQVFCVCATSRDFHVGAHDTVAAFRRAVERDGLLLQRGAQFEDDYIYVPTRPTPELAGRLEEAERESRAEVARVYEILKEAFPTYKKGKRLADQDPAIHEGVITAFKRLAEDHFLPATTTCSNFSHQGMILLMEQCFRSRDRFVAYLREPALLADPADRLEELNLERLELLEKEFVEGKLELEEQARLNELTNEIRGMLPAVSSTDYRALDEMMLELRNIEASRHRRALRGAGERPTKAE